MDQINYSIETFESIENYRKIMLLIFLSESDSDLLE